MSVIDHEHQIEPKEGRLLFPDEIESRGLDSSKKYYINGRCNLSGCDYFTFAEIPTLKIRGPRLANNRK